MDSQKNIIQRIDINLPKYIEKTIILIRNTIEINV